MTKDHFEAARLFWKVAKVWNSGVGRMQVGNAIRSLKRAQELSSPTHPVHHRSGRLMNEIIYGQADSAVTTAVNES